MVDVRHATISRNWDFAGRATILRALSRTKITGERAKRIRVDAAIHRNVITAGIDTENIPVRILCLSIRILVEVSSITVDTAQGYVRIHSFARRATVLRAFARAKAWCEQTESVRINAAVGWNIVAGGVDTGTVTVLIEGLGVGAGIEFVALSSVQPSTAAAVPASSFVVGVPASEALAVTPASVVVLLSSPGQLSTSKFACCRRKECRRYFKLLEVKTCLGESRICSRSLHRRNRVTKRSPLYSH